MKTYNQFLETPFSLVEGDVHSGQGEKIQKRTKAWMDKKGQKGAPGLDAMKARSAEHKAKRGVKEEVQVDEANKAERVADRYRAGKLSARPVGKRASKKSRTTAWTTANVGQRNRNRFGDGKERKLNKFGSDYQDTPNQPKDGSRTRHDAAQHQRRKEHEARRGVKTKGVKEEKDAFAYVVAKLKKQHGDGVLTKRDKIKPQSAAEKAKVRAHQAKVDKENAAERAKDPSQGRYPKG